MQTFLFWCHFQFFFFILFFKNSGTYLFDPRSFRLGTFFFVRNLRDFCGSIVVSKVPNCYSLKNLDVRNRFHQRVHSKLEEAHYRVAYPRDFSEYGT